jgi:hypothetical protein
MSTNDDEVKDPLEAMDEEDSEDEDLDEKKLSAGGLHIEEDEDLHDPEVPVDPFVAKDILLKDPLLPEDEDVEDDSDEPELGDEEFADKTDLW